MVVWLTPNCILACYKVLVSEIPLTRWLLKKSEVSHPTSSYTLVKAAVCGAMCDGKVHDCVIVEQGDIQQQGLADVPCRLLCGPPALMCSSTDIW